jgi:hypothetical protein
MSFLLTASCLLCALELHPTSLSWWGDSEGQFIFSLIPLRLCTEKLELYKQTWRNEIKKAPTIVGWLLSFDLVINLVIR